MRDILRRLLGWKAAAVTPVVTDRLDIQYYTVPPEAHIHRPAAVTRIYRVGWRDGK